MPSITIRNIPDHIYEQLKQHAEASHRSLNSQIIFYIEQAMSSQVMEPEAFLVRARSLRELSAHYVISDEEFTQVKREGRR